MRTDEFDYDLPPELIAQEPLPDRDQSRMMVLDRRTGEIRHDVVRNLPGYLHPGDLLVLNDTKVIPARLLGRKAETGGQVELLLLEDMGGGRWTALCGASRRPGIGARLILGAGKIEAVVRERFEDGRLAVDLLCDRPLMEVLQEEGLPPLPPYIKRDYTSGDTGRRADDMTRYQTVYARVPGAVAAPTAGLHLTRTLIETLERQGVPHCAVTLHVGIGTFRPVATETVEEHRMGDERYEVPPSAVGAIRAARRAGGRIVAVGSTVVRTLETAAAGDGVAIGQGRTTIFIHPPYRFRVVDCLLTNFHLPRSTLLMMVSALAGRDAILAAYREAVRARYRFYSYGDCMLIL